jgi:hypothetical protein
MSGDKADSAMAGAGLMLGGVAFARLGWAGVKRRASEPQPGRELAAAAPGTSPPWKALWLLCLLFGAFILVCGLFLLLSVLLPEQTS